jgi:hypothetical protein
MLPGTTNPWLLCQLAPSRITTAWASGATWLHVTVGLCASYLEFSYVLRNELGLSNPHFGCGLAQCGGCTVHVDGAPTRSCWQKCVSSPVATDVVERPPANGRKRKRRCRPSSLSWESLLACYEAGPRTDALLPVALPATPVPRRSRACARVAGRNPRHKATSPSVCSCNRPFGKMVG